MLTSEQIEQDIQEFLADGGEIKRIPRGVSGERSKKGMSEVELLAEKGQAILAMMGKRYTKREIAGFWGVSESAVSEGLKLYKQSQQYGFKMRRKQ